MEEAIRKQVDKKGNKSITYNKSWEKDGFRFSKEIRQVEGGYIIRESKYGNDKDGKYVDEVKEYVTTENPFQEKKRDDDEKMFSFVDQPIF